jgi:hypothetical protein
MRKINLKLETIFKKNRIIINITRAFLWLSLVTYMYITCFIPLYFIDEGIQVPFIFLCISPIYHLKVAKENLFLSGLLFVYFSTFIIILLYFIFKPRLLNIKNKILPLFRLLILEMFFLASFSCFVIVNEKKLLFTVSNPKDDLMRLTIYKCSNVFIILITLSILFTTYLNIKNLCYNIKSRKEIEK